MSSFFSDWSKALQNRNPDNAVHARRCSSLQTLFCQTLLFVADAAPCCLSARPCAHLSCGSLFFFFIHKENLGTTPINPGPRLAGFIRVGPPWGGQGYPSYPQDSPPFQRLRDLRDRPHLPNAFAIYGRCRTPPSKKRDLRVPCPRDLRVPGG